MISSADFGEKLYEVIVETQTTIFEIERIIFTKRYSLSKTHYEILSTQSISMIYALWEGYVQKAFNLYIDELNRNDRTTFAFRDEIIIYQMENRFKQLREYPEKPSSKIKYFANLKEFLNGDEAIFRLVDTKSNVGFEILNNLLQTFALETFPEHWCMDINPAPNPKPNLKDTLKSFLKLRNSIAHGGAITSEDMVTQQVFQKYKNLIIDLMFEIRVKMLHGLDKATYKK
jgi:MAE_28990/MAE_18760-like HEPN